MANDQPTDKDTLGLDPYFKGLTKFVMTCDTPMTIAIQGGWGTGKTSALRIIEQQLKSDKIRSIWFDTWQFAVLGQDDNLLWHLMRSFERAAQGENSNKIKDEGSLGERAFDVVASASKEAAKQIGNVLSSTNLTAATEAAMGVEVVPINLLGRFLSDAPDIDKLDDVRNRIQSYINKLADIGKDESEVSPSDRRRVVVFIDDLDRLEPIRALGLLEGIKNFIDCKHCVFVLAVDANVVREGIAAKYHFENNDDAKEYTRHFFDKIIQVPFEMREDQYDFKSYIKGESLLGESDPSDACLEQYTRAIDAFDIRNPRSVKRVFSLVQLYGCMDESYDAEERLMLFIVLLTQMRHPDTLRLLVREAQTNVGNLENLIGRSAETTGCHEASIKEGLQAIQHALGGELWYNESEEVWELEIDEAPVKSFAKALRRFASPDPMASDLASFFVDTLGLAPTVVEPDAKQQQRGYRVRTMYKWEGAELFNMTSTDSDARFYFQPNKIGAPESVEGEFEVRVWQSGKYLIRCISPEGYEFVKEHIRQIVSSLAARS